MRFICVYVDEDLDSAAPEKLLIKEYRRNGGIPWNTNGFGNNDPGRNRDRSLVKAKHFDALYPIDLDLPLSFENLNPSVVHALQQINANLPYSLRWDKKPAALRDLIETKVDFSHSLLTARSAMRDIIGVLPEEWQATALPGYLILYPESSVYESAICWWQRGTDGSVDEIPGPTRFADGEVELDPDEALAVESSEN